MKIKKLGALAAAALLPVFLAGCDGVITPTPPPGGDALWTFPDAGTSAGVSVTMQQSGHPLITPPAFEGTGGLPVPGASVPFVISGRAANHYGLDVLLPLQAGDVIYVTGTTPFAVQPRNHPYDQFAAAVLSSGGVYIVSHTVVTSNIRTGAQGFRIAGGDDPNLAGQDIRITSIRVYR